MLQPFISERHTLLSVFVSVTEGLKYVEDCVGFCSTQVTTVPNFVNLNTLNQVLNSKIYS